MTLPGQIGGNNNNYWNSNKWTNNNNWNNWTNNQNNWNVNINNNWGVQGGWGGGYWGNGSWVGGSWGSGYFGDYWYGNHVRPWHQNWYHGCWNGHWGNNWYVPLAYGVTGWALGASAANWGYGYTYSYSNPYYVVSPEPVYDYSQPIVIYNQTTVAADPNADPAELVEPAPATPAEELARQEFELAMARFQAGDYVQALSAVDAAIRQVADDPIMHEFRALCQFAVGQYQPAAATLNSLLAVAPGMDWTSMSSLYGDTNDYVSQLKRLQDYVQKNGQDAAARFVLAYHYLVVGEQASALEQLEKVVELQPQDLTASRMVTALKPAPEPEVIPEPQPPAADAVPAAAPAAEAPAGADEEPGPTTSLVGTWVATADKTKIELSVDEELNFVWKATLDGKTNELKGQLASDADAIAFETKDQGTLTGQATSQGPDKFNFRAFGAPPSDKGLTFERVK